MKTPRPIPGLWVWIVVVATTCLAAGCSTGPCIRGSYVLDHRDLPDGRQVRSPEVIGMMTFTRDHRNFNVYWKQDGKPVSISIISKYSISRMEYTEENIYTATNGVDGKGPTYDTSPASGRSPVSVSEGKIQFKLPLHDEPKLTFDKDTLTATRLGAFVDHWKKMR